MLFLFRRMRAVHYFVLMGLQRYLTPVYSMFRMERNFCVWLLFFVAYIDRCLQLSNGCIGSRSRLELADILPEKPTRYNKLQPPFANISEIDPTIHDPTVVGLYFYVMAIDSINEASMTFTTDIYFHLVWSDQRLRYPKRIAENLTQLNPEWLKKIWHPEVHFRKAKSIKRHMGPVPNQYLRFYRNKTLRLSVRISSESSCNMNFVMYPLDRHVCKIQIESLSHPDKSIKFVFESEPVWFDETFKLPQMLLVGTNNDDCTRVRRTGNYSCLEVGFILKRSMGYYLIHTYIPTCLIVIVSWITFWIKPEALSARVSLGVTSLLTLLTQHSKSQESLPHVTYLKFGDAFMIASIIFVFLPLIEICLIIIILSFSQSSSQAKRELRKKRRRISKSSNSSEANSNNERRVPRLYPVHQSTQKLRRSSSSMNGYVEFHTNSQRREYALQLDCVCRILFPSMFIILNSIYWSWALFSD